MDYERIMYQCFIRRMHHIFSRKSALVYSIFSFPFGEMLERQRSLGMLNAESSRSAASRRAMQRLGLDVPIRTSGARFSREGCATGQSFFGCTWLESIRDTDGLSWDLAGACTGCPVTHKIEERVEIMYSLFHFYS